MIAPVHSEQYSPKKQRTVVVCVSAGEMPPDQMMHSSFEAYYMSCQGSTICPKQFSKSQPKKITLMWQLTGIVSFDLLRCTQERNKTLTRARTLPHLQRSDSFTVETKALLGSWTTFRGCTQVSCYSVLYMSLNVRNVGHFKQCSLP